MIEIAIVEDEAEHAKMLENYIRRYAGEHGDAFAVTCFSNPIPFLEQYTAKYDIIFMDIRMPLMSGMDAARRLRELDKNVVLIFITSLTQYAVEGYEVNALSYIVKPATYTDFSLKFTRAYEQVRRNEGNMVYLPTENGMVKLSPAEIVFCEVSGHTVILHTVRGDFSRYASLRAVEERLCGEYFAKCNHCYLVNLRYVKDLSKNETELNCNGKRYILQVSRNKRKSFANAWQAYIERTGRG